MLPFPKLPTARPAPHPVPTKTSETHLVQERSGLTEEKQLHFRGTAGLWRRDGLPLENSRLDFREDSTCAVPSAAPLSTDSHFHYYIKFFFSTILQVSMQPNSSRTPDKSLGLIQCGYPQKALTLALCPRWRGAAAPCNRQGAH